MRAHPHAPQSTRNVFEIFDFILFCKLTISLHSQINIKRESAPPDPRSSSADVKYGHRDEWAAWGPNQLMQKDSRE